MSINEAIKASIEPLVSICVPDVYAPEPQEPSATEYATFNYTEIGADFGDDTANAVRYLLQLHWFLPSGVNPIDKKKQIKKALLQMGGTYPEVFNASDQDGQHWIFECEYADGDV